MTALPTMGAMPGFSTLAQTIEAAVTWGGDRAPFLEQEGIPLHSSTVDAGNTPTTYLRPGLILGKATSGTAAGLLKAYSASATDGSQVPFGVLLRGISMLDLNGVAENKYGKILVGGPVKSNQLIGLDYQARRQMSGRFQFDDDIPDANGALLLPAAEVAKTANYQLLASDNNTLFTNAGAAGAVVFTLPALANSQGLAFEFLVVAAQNVTITCPDGADIVWDGALKTNLAFSTASHQIGGHLVMLENAAGTAWYVRNVSPSTTTITAS